MASAQEVYNGDAGRRDMLKRVWPELHAVLDAGFKATTEGPRTTVCAVHRDPSVAVADRPVATARLTLNGPPACRECLARSPRPGVGYPLERQDVKKWSDRK